ncbi:MAG TPA: hypothetical protein VK473_10875 [Terriglobales bacterium]|nr:hypothetical protein [Terriglobales bacterium]
MQLLNRVLFAMGLLMLLAAGAFAQDRVIANVPFSFTANNHEFTGGTYSISHLADDLKILAIRNNASNETILVHTFAGDPTGDAKLTFHRYGETYFLVSVSTPDAVHELARSKAENRLRAANPGAETVVAALGQ